MRQLCSFSAVLPQIQVLTARGWEILPILSASAAGLDTRFGTAAALRQTLLELTGHEALTTLQGVEPLGPQKLADAPYHCPRHRHNDGTAGGGHQRDPVTLAAKSLLRGGRPIILAPSTNDGLAGSAPALGQLCSGAATILYPFGQDDCYKKPRSLKVISLCCPIRWTLPCAGIAAAADAGVICSRAGGI